MPPFVVEGQVVDREGPRADTGNHELAGNDVGLTRATDLALGIDCRFLDAHTLDPVLAENLHRRRIKPEMHLFRFAGGADIEEGPHCLYILFPQPQIAVGHVIGDNLAGQVVGIKNRGGVFQLAHLTQFDIGERSFHRTRAGRSYERP